jgi:anti-sigma factor RsiW
VNHPRDAGTHLGDLLSALLDGELPPAEEAEAHRHLDSCPRCAAELVDVGTARAWVRGLPAVTPPAGFLERLLLNLERPASRRASLGRRVGLAVVAGSAAAALALIGLTPPRDTPVSPSVARLVEAHATGASLEGDPLSRLAPLGVPVTFQR